MKYVFSRTGILITLLFAFLNAQTSIHDNIINDGDDIIMEIEEEQAERTATIDKMPVIINFVQADYPPELIQQGVQGIVLLELLVNEAGSVDSVSVVNGIHPKLDSSAVIAARKFTFSPAQAQGDSVAVILQYEYRFTLEDAVDSIQQYCNYTGQLLEKGTRAPVRDAMIVVAFPGLVIDPALPLPFDMYLKKIGSFSTQSLEENRLVVTTDSSGVFNFYSLPVCSIEVQIIMPGYEQFKTTEFINNGEELRAKYYIAKTNYSDYEIVVYGKTEEKEVSRRQLTLQEIRKIPGLGGDAVKVVQAMPGVARPSFGSGDVIVRGAPTWDSKFYLDGVRIPQLYHMGGLKSTYNSEALQGLDFLPGGFGTRYGGATAGVIELKGRKAAEDRWHGNLDLSTIDGSFLVEGPINKKVSVLATARRSFIGDIAEWITKKYDDYFPMTMSTFYWDYVLRTDIKLSKNNNLFLTVFGSRDSLAMIFPDMQGGSKEIDEANNRLGTRTTSTMGLLGWDYNNGKHWSNSARYALSSVGSSFSTFGYWKSETEVWENYFRDQLTYSLSDNFKINAGLDINCANYDMKMAIIDGSYTIQRHNIKNWKFSDAGAYLNMEIKPTEKLTIYPGIRFDYYQELIHNGSIVPEFWNYSEFNNERGISGDPSLRINSKYEINEDHLVKLSIGNYNQTPQPIGQTIIKPWGEPSLPTTKAAHYVAGHEWKITDLISSDVQVYFNNQWDLPTYAENSDLSTEGGEQKAFNPNGRGRMYGLELMLRHMQSEHFFGWIAYTLSKTERKNMADDSWDLYDEDMTHNLQVLGSWHLRKQWDTGFRLRYVTGKPTTPVTGITYKENDLYYEPVYGKKNSSRMDPFFQLDLRVDKKFVYDKWMHSFYLDLQNVSYIFYKSPEYVQHNYNYKDSKNISMFPMLGIGFKAEF